MKAAVINAFGEIPQYKDFPDPKPGKDDVLVYVKAAVLENFDRGTAAGTHYSSKKLYPQFPAVTGTKGIGMTRDGRLVGFGKPVAPYGAFAEKVIAGYTYPLPEGVDPAKAAAILPSVLTSLLSLKYAAKLQEGEKVLINGATGASGRTAVQVARLLGAGSVTGTGRNENSLKLVSKLGADGIISLQQPDDLLAEAFIRSGGKNGYDVVLDFLWGRPAKVFMDAFVPKTAGFAPRRTRYIQIGEKAGSEISVSGSAIRTSGLELMGIGQISPEILTEETNRVLQWIKEDKFYMDIEKVPLADIGAAWRRSDLDGKRLVVIP